MTEISLRQAEIGDARAVASFHVAVWRDAYRTLAPPEAHAILDEHHRLASWQEKLAKPALDQRVVLAERGGVVVGIGVAGAPSEEIFGTRGEIKYLYIAQDTRRQGLGRLILSDLAVHLAGRGYTGAALSVVEGNHPAMAFYERLGGRAIGRYVDAGPIWRSRNIVLAWDNIARLAQ